MRSVWGFSEISSFSCNVLDLVVGSCEAWNNVVIGLHEINEPGIEGREKRPMNRVLSDAI